MKSYVAIWTDEAELLQGDPNLWRLENKDNPPFAVVPAEEYEAAIRAAFAEGQGVEAELLSADELDALAKRWEDEAELRDAGVGNGPKFEANKHALAFRQAAMLQRAEDERQRKYEESELREKRQIA